MESYTRLRRTAILAFRGSSEMPSFRGVLALMLLLRLLLSLGEHLTAPLFVNFSMDVLHVPYADTVIMYLFHAMVVFTLGVVTSHSVDYLPVMPILLVACALGAVYRFLLGGYLAMPLLGQLFLACVFLPTNDTFLRGPLQLALKRVVRAEYAGSEAEVKRRLGQFVSYYYALHNVAMVIASVSFYLMRLRKGYKVQANVTMILWSGGALVAAFLLLLLIRRLAPRADRPSPNVRIQAVDMTWKSKRFWRALGVMLSLTGVMSFFTHIGLTLTKYLLIVQGPDSNFPLLQLINPCVVILFTPFMPGLLGRWKVHSYDAFIMGSTVSALGVIGMGAVGQGSVVGIIVGLVVFSVGESIWSPRLTEYALETAPEGFEAVYQALAQLPALLYIVLAPLLSAVLIKMFCTEATCNGTAIWTILGMVAACSPLALSLGRRWLDVMDEDGEEEGRIK